jgi:FdhE protein
MHRTARRVRIDPASRLGDVGRQRPEWRTWLNLLSEVESALQDAWWRAPLPDALPGDFAAGSDAKAPLLHRRRLEIHSGRTRQLVRRLASAAAGSLGRYGPSAEEAVGLVAAAVRQDTTELAALAAAAGVDGGALSSVAHLASLPLLQAYGRFLESQVPRSWSDGYCPVCAAWPILVERRGLDRTSWLRCGRCAVEWEMQGLCCVYCGERDHRRLGSLVPEEHGESLKVEICDHCGGYLKSVATLQRIPAIELLLRDLETVELDLVALNRGYGRPVEPGFPLEVGPR